MFLVFYFLVVIALPMALGIYVVVNGLQRSRRCPACADETRGGTAYNCLGDCADGRIAKLAAKGAKGKPATVPPAH
jgi:hypothetical protein